jgi:4-hydroxybenzoate polyprenyltransferase
MSVNHENLATSSNRPLELFKFHLYTIWLFTQSDLKCIVFPETAFGLFSALSGSQITTNPSPILLNILGRLPKVILWNWLNLLIFALANQRLPESIREDTVNKPWRPIPTQRISIEGTTRLLLWTIPAVLLFISWLGGQHEYIAMLVLTWMYNDLGGADDHYLTRNAINALGFICYSSGSTIVAAGYEWKLNARGNIWLVIVAGIIFSTIQMQDMADMKGDALRGRRTLPLVRGQEVARWSIAIPVIFWSFFCPRYWHVSIWVYTLPVSVGILLAVRVVCQRTFAADRITWKIWCVWTTMLYLLPLCKDYSVLGRFLELV